MLTQTGSDRALLPLDDERTPGYSASEAEKKFKGRSMAERRQAQVFENVKAVRLTARGSRSVSRDVSEQAMSSVACFVPALIA
jgi:hypothetical protein